jgi:hypothetical protein
VLTSYLISLVLKLIPNAPAAHERMLQMKLVDKPHQLKITGTDRNSFVIKTRTRKFKDLALPGQR